MAALAPHRPHDRGRRVADQPARAAAAVSRQDQGRGDGVPAAGTAVDGLVVPATGSNGNGLQILRHVSGLHGARTAPAML